MTRQHQGGALILLVEILRTLTTSGLVYNRPNASGKLQYTPKSGEVRVMPS